MVVRGLKRAGVSIACSLPDSLLKELHPALHRDPEFRTTIRVTSGGAAIRGGAFLSGKRAALVTESPGPSAAAKPLARMGLGAGIPPRC